MNGEHGVLEALGDAELSEENELLSSDEWIVGSQVLCWGKRRRIHYHLYALIHPINLFSVLGLIAIGLIDGALWVTPTALAADLLLSLGVLPRLKPFRRLVDHYFERLDRLQAVKRIAQRRQESEPIHRMVYDELVQLVGEIYHGADSTVSLLVKDQFTPARLLWRFIHLASLHKQLASIQTKTNRELLDQQLKQLGFVRQRAASPLITRLIEQRLVLLEKRAAQWDRTSLRLRVVHYQLEIIEDMLRLLHAKALTPMNSATLCEELEQYSDQFSLSESSMRELAELDRDLGAPTDPMIAELLFEEIAPPPPATPAMDQPTHSASDPSKRRPSAPPLWG